MINALHRNRLSGVLIFYSLLTLVFFWPAISAGPGIIGENGDELQAAWNLWWTKFSLLTLHANPHYTNWLHFPLGISLYFHPLAFLNGLFYIALSPLLSLEQSYNLILLFSFPATGLAGYWLARDCGLRFWTALLYGYALTFSNYHFVQALGHLELVSIQWLVLAVIAVRRLWFTPGWCSGIAAGLALSALTFISLYFVLYAGMFFLLMGVYSAFQHKEPVSSLLKTFSLTALILASLTGWYYLSFAGGMVSDPPVMGHSVEKGSLDLLGIILPGPDSFIAHMGLPCFKSAITYRWEQGLGIGFAIFLSLLLACSLRKLRGNRECIFWLITTLFFAALSLGPEVRIADQKLPSIPMPYAMFDAVFPLARISGLPVRFSAMTLIAGALCFTFCIQALADGRKWQRILALTLCSLMIIETLPKPMPRRRIAAPEWVTALSNLPNPEQSGVLPLYQPNIADLYYQTIHQQPLAFGYTARTTVSARKQIKRIRKLIRLANWQALCQELRFAFLLQPADRPALNSPLLGLRHESQMRIYALTCP